jgi:hypothetical protein
MAAWEGVEQICPSVQQQCTILIATTLLRHPWKQHPQQDKIAYKYH